MLEALGITKKVKTVDTVLNLFHDAISNLQDVVSEHNFLAVNKQEEADRLYQESIAHGQEVKRAKNVIGQFERILSTGTETEVSEQDDTH